MDADCKEFGDRIPPYSESEMNNHAEQRFYETKEDTAVLSTASDVATGENTVHRALEQRHISMIAIGGTIGESLLASEVFQQHIAQSW